ncbi:hypothetical protein MWN34_02580 [Ancylobacter sp. 6x-1]|uniref:STAS domain-containing protein n=1 Tax=Ancylobacter crimeensis TaxID=2579147 RepID=A0ABT0D779_9HYPH|nr:hypothetical protein [Ancylobacter crimeensis]MCK0195787.1 hypothetical protein [Ancylobacter crimeensis]
MEIKTGDFRVWDEGSTIYFDGIMRLSGSEAYAPILDLMMNVLASGASTVTLNLTDLEFLNSSGINLLAKFTIETRRHPEVQLVVRGAQSVPWQSKSLRNLQKLHPSVTLLVD